MDVHPRKKGLIFIGGAPICKRLSDGTYWEPSHPGYCDLTMHYYFRRIKKVWWRYFRRSGEIWQFKDRKLFEIVNGCEVDPKGNPG